MSKSDVWDRAFNVLRNIPMVAVNEKRGSVNYDVERYENIKAKIEKLQEQIDLGRIELRDNALDFVYDVNLRIRQGQKMFSEKQEEFASILYAKFCE